MMHGPEKSDSSIVAMKPANKAGQPAAESVERREGAEGNMGEPRTRRTPSRESVSQGLDRVRQAAKARKKERFTALLHHVMSICSRMRIPGSSGMRRRGWTGSRGGSTSRTWKPTLWICMRAFTAAPIGRYPRGGSTCRKRMGGNARSGSLRWKTKSSSVRWWKCSMQSMKKTFWGSRMGSDPGAASTMRWTRLRSAITRTKVNWILDADVRVLFRLGQSRMADPFRGTSDRRSAHDPPDSQVAEGWGDGGWGNTPTEAGTPQGAVVSPLLANIYLHYVFDLWAERWRHHHAHGNVIFVRYADDIVCGFEHEADARRFHAALQQRMEKFALSLHPDKTRLIEFGRFAATNRAARPWQTGDVQLSWFRSHLWSLPTRPLPAQAEDAPGPDASQAASHQRRTAAAHA